MIKTHNFFASILHYHTHYIIVILYYQYIFIIIYLRVNHEQITSYLIYLIRMKHNILFKQSNYCSFNTINKNL